MKRLIVKYLETVTGNATNRFTDSTREVSCDVDCFNDIIVKPCYVIEILDTSTGNVYFGEDFAKIRQSMFKADLESWLTTVKGMLLLVPGDTYQLPNVVAKNLINNFLSNKGMYPFRAPGYETVSFDDLIFKSNTDYSWDEE